MRVKYVGPESKKVLESKSRIQRIIEAGLRCWTGIRSYIKGLIS